MNVFLVDNIDLKKSFLPLTYTRSIASLRLGKFNFFERWDWFTNQTPTLFNEASIIKEEDLLVSSHVLVTKDFIDRALDLNENTSLWMGNRFLARKGSQKLNTEEHKIQVEVTYLESIWDLTEKSAQVLESDLELIKKRHYSSDIQDPYTIVYAKKNLFVSEGVTIKAAILNAEKGPIFIDKNAQILEGAVIHGPAFIGKNTTVTPNSKLLGGVYLGPSCVVGGEMKRSYIHAYSNKAHEGYLGDSILGSWCNLGAGTNVSNLKNNFGDIRMWSYGENKVVKTTRWKAGVLMGDYCKTSIGSRINSGTTMGVGTVVFDSELSAKYYKNFSWGAEKYDFDKFIDSARRMWEINGLKGDQKLENRLRSLFP